MYKGKDAKPLFRFVVGCHDDGDNDNDYNDDKDDD